jgi:hypothetical protein
LGGGGSGDSTRDGGGAATSATALPRESVADGDGSWVDSSKLAAHVVIA